jgi:CMP-N-acetylneuraminic acid synthetase
MKLAVISFAREGSRRLPKKNTMLFNGKPLIWYTLQVMKYLKENYTQTELECYVLTDYKECQEICEKEGIKVIWRDHPKEWDDIRLNQWAHEKINADAYLLL